MNEYGLRDDTMETVIDAVYTLANNFLNPSDGSDEPITIKDAVEYCYQEFNSLIEQVYGHSRASRFDGKRKILHAIECEIRDCEYIILKTEK